MILMNKKDGVVIPFVEYEFVRGDLLALYSDDISYIVQLENIEQKLEEGNAIDGTFPILYDTFHGALTNESMMKFGVSVRVKAFADKNSKTDIKNMFIAIRACGIDSLDFDALFVAVKKQEENDMWLKVHRQEVEKAFGQAISEKELNHFSCYDTFEAMEEDFGDDEVINLSKPYIKKILDKWVIRLT